MNNMKIKNLLFIGLIGLTTMMCVLPNLDTEYFVRKEPKITELVGKYAPTTQTMKLITEVGKYEIDENGIVIILMANGKFEMNNMPDWWNTDFGTPEGGKDSGKGSWRLIRHQDWWDVQFNFDSREHFNSDKSSYGLIKSVPLVGDTPPYFLWFYIGDPDSGKVMVFERVSIE